MRSIPINILKQYIIMRSLHVVMAGCIIVLALIITLAFAWPIRSPIRITDAPLSIASTDSNHFRNLLHPQDPSSNASSVSVRSGLFKSASRLHRAPEDSTVERIKSQLKLCSLTSLKGAPIAFVSIEGKGMRPCRIGETILDSFKVLDIDLEQKKVDVEITGKKTTLNIK